MRKYTQQAYDIGRIIDMTERMVAIESALVKAHWFGVMEEAERRKFWESK